MKVRKRDSVRWRDQGGEVHRSMVHRTHRNGTITVSSPSHSGPPLMAIPVEWVVEIVSDYPESDVRHGNTAIEMVKGKDAHYFEVVMRNPFQVPSERDMQARIKQAMEAAQPRDPIAVVADMEGELHRLFQVNLAGHFDSPNGLETVGIGRILERMTEMVERIETYKDEHGIGQRCRYCRTGEGSCCECV